jgi:hypothetical protein
MEIREEKLATWADPSLAHTARILTGTICLRQTNTDKCVQITDQKVQFDQIVEHISSTTDFSDTTNSDLWHFKAISFTRLQPGRLKISMPKETFQQIQSAWHLHPRTIEVFLSNNGVFTTFHCPDSDRTSYILKVANSRSTGFDCTSVTFNPTERTIYVLYHHLEDEASVFATLLSTPERCIDPHFFVAALYRSHQQHIETHRNTIDDAIQAMERRSKLGNPGRLASETRRRPSLEYYPVLEDPKGAIQQLSYCQTDLAIIGHVARCASELGGWLEQAIDESLANQQPSENPRAVLVAIREDVEYTRRRTDMLLSQVQQMKDRAQSQTGFVSLHHRRLPSSAANMQARY